MNAGRGGSGSRAWRGPAIAVILTAATVSAGNLFLINRASEDADSHGLSGQESGRSGADSSSVSPGMASAGAVGSEAVVPLNELTARVSDLASTVKDLRGELESLRANVQWSRPSADSVDWEAPPIFSDSSVEGSPADALMRQYESETSVGRWGKDVSSTIKTVFESRAAESPLFATYGGELESLCRQTVCKLSWGSAPLGGLEESQRAEVFEKARWDLMAAIGQAGVSGQVAVTTGERDGIPTMTVLFQQDSAPILMEEIKK